MRLVPTRRSRQTTATVFDIRRLSAGVLAVVALSASPVLALSVFDAIQLSKHGYSDRAIIELIEATDSAFALEADDLPKLKQLGVSERVIRAMLERAVTLGDAGAGHNTEPVPMQDKTVRAPASRPDNPFTAQRLLEKRHTNQAQLSLALDGLELLVLRDEGGHASIESRGQAIVERLGESWVTAGGPFKAEPVTSGTRVVFLIKADDTKGGETRTIPILTASAGDARGYELRSGRRVTPDLLARYWADLFSDFWAMGHSESPERLLHLREGEALTVLREALTRPGESDQTYGAAAEGVPDAMRKHLQRLAQTVPKEYGRATER